MLTGFFNQDILIALLTGYNSAVKERRCITPAPIDYLTDNGGTDALPALVKKSKKFAAKLAKYERIIQAEDMDIPTFYKYLVDMASEKITQDFLKYKEEMLLKGAELIFKDAYYINIATNISYFFNELRNSCSICDEDMARILEYSLLDGFFESIMFYAEDVDSFDVSNLGRTTEEIRSFVYHVSPSMWRRHDKK